MTWLGQPQLYSESVCWFNPYIAVYDTTCLFRGEKQSHFTVHYSRVSTTCFFFCFVRYKTNCFIRGPHYYCAKCHALDWPFVILREDCGIDYSNLWSINFVLR